MEPLKEGQRFRSMEEMEAYRSAEEAKATYLLLVTARNDCPHLWDVYEAPYWHTFDSVREARNFVRRQNRYEPGYFPRGSYQLLYGVWSQEALEKLHDGLWTACRDLV